MLRTDRLLSDFSSPVKGVVLLDGTIVTAGFVLKCKACLSQIPLRGDMNLVELPKFTP